MAQVTFDTASMMQALAPGLPNFIVNHFKEHIEKEMNTAIAEAHKKALETLPQHVETTIYNMFDPTWANDKIKVVVDLRTPECTQKKT